MLVDLDLWFAALRR